MVKTYILRCTFDINDKLVQSRLQSLERDERDQYLEQVKECAETYNWICTELKTKVLDMMEITKQTYQDLFTIPCLENGGSLLTVADQRLLEDLRAD